MSPYLCNVANGGHKPAYKIQSAYMNNSNIERFKTNENSLKRVVQTSTFIKNPSARYILWIRNQ